MFIVLDAKFWSTLLHCSTLYIISYLSKVFVPLSLLESLPFFAHKGLFFIIPLLTSILITVWGK